MTPFTVHRGIIAPLDTANVDTDQIIPKQFLKSIKRTGFGPALFCDWRYLPDGRDNPEFELNAPRYKGRSVLVTRNNFGCGSSREHAVWALAQDGYRAVIAPYAGEGASRTPGFADIFRNNCVKNGIATVELAPEQVDEIFTLVRDHAGLEATVDLQAEKVVLHTPDGDMTYPFKYDPASREVLLNGLDDIAMSLQYADSISRFERAHDSQLAGV